MSRKQFNRDPVKRAAKRQARREAQARGSKINAREAAPSQSQMTHASSGRAKKKSREDERRLRREP